MQTTPRRPHARPVASASPRKRTVRKPATPPLAATAVSPFRAAAIAALGIVVLSGLVFALVRETGITATKEPVASTYPAFFLRDEFKGWLSTWKQQDPYLAPEEFRLVRKAPLAPTDAYSGAAATPDGSARFVYAKDGRRYVDILAAFGEPDSRVDVGGLLADGRVTTVTFCGTACSFDKVFWTGPDTFIVLGTMESYKPDGTPLCVGDDETRTCYKRLVATEYDLLANEERVYESADRVVTSDPFEEEKSRVWFVGRPAAERVAAGVYETSELVPFSGEIVSASHALLGVRNENAEMVFVALSYGKVGTKFADQRIDVGPGALIEGAALRDGEGVIATEIAVKEPGSVFVHMPGPGEIIPRTFQVGLSTLPSVAKVLLEITDARGETIVSKTVLADGDLMEEGRIGFQIPITLPTGLDPEEFCALSASAQGETAKMTVPFVCGPVLTPVDN